MAEDTASGETYGDIIGEMITNYNAVSKSTPKFFRGTRETEIANDYIPAISASDVRRGYIYRYFTRQTNYSNAGEIIEIEKSHYEKLKNIPLFVTAELKWKISGKKDDIFSNDVDKTGVRLYTSVKAANAMSLDLVEKELPGIKNKITDLYQYYQGE